MLATPENRPGPQTRSCGLQEVACVFLVLCALLQLNILSTRNPNVWWWFNKKQGSGAPPPSLVLVFFMSIFLLAATFVAVYWPSNVRPDGGRGWMEGAGTFPTPLPSCPRVSHVVHCYAVCF